MTGLACVLALLLIMPQSKPKDLPVDSTFAKRTDFASFHTYSWVKGREAYNPAAHKTIVEAIDAQMAALGFTKAEGSAADVTVKYHSVLSLDVDLKTIDKEGKTGPVPTQKLGILAVVMTDRADQQVWAAKSREYIDDKALDEAIRRAVSRIFATYPARKTDSRKF